VRSRGGVAQVLDGLGNPSSLNGFMLLGILLSSFSLSHSIGFCLHSLNTYITLPTSTPWGSENFRGGTPPYALGLQNFYRKKQNSTAPVAQPTQSAHHQARTTKHASQAAYYVLRVSWQVALRWKKWKPLRTSFWR